MAETVHIKGLDQLGKALRALPVVMARRVVRKATAQPAALIRDTAKIIAPVYDGEIAQGQPQPGTLKKSIQLKRITGLPPERCVYIVWVRHGKNRQRVGKKGLNLDAYYWWWVEFGTAKMPARPFLRPAFEMSKESALRMQIDGLGRGILEASKEVRWGRPT